MTDKLYAERLADELSPWFERHLSAMTKESLHSKSDIACELAVRDIEIESLRQQVKELTIPEGWQLVTTERMKELEEYEFMYKSVSK